MSFPIPAGCPILYPQQVVPVLGPLAAEFWILRLAIQCFMEHIILRLRDRHRMRYGQATKDPVTTSQKSSSIPVVDGTSNQGTSTTARGSCFIPAWRDNCWFSPTALVITNIQYNFLYDFVAKPN
jgi:hypothetical protein